MISEPKDARVVWMIPLKTLEIHIVLETLSYILTQNLRKSLIDMKVKKQFLV